MGSALWSAWNDNDCVNKVTAIAPHPERITGLVRSRDRVVNDPSTLETGKEEKFDSILFAVKSQILGSVLENYTAHISPDTTIISIAAGKPTEFLRQHLQTDQNTAIIRAMPNTPCQIGEGVIGCYADESVSERHRQHAEALFKPSALVFWVKDEAQMHGVTAVSGSGPGFVFAHMEELEQQGLLRHEVIEDVLASLDPDSNSRSTAFLSAFAQAAIDEGFENNLAHAIVRQTVKGSAKLAEHRADKSFAELRQAVTSPNGTTEAGLNVWNRMKENDIGSRMHDTVGAACNRSRQLAMPVTT